MRILLIILVITAFTLPACTQGAKLTSSPSNIASSEIKEEIKAMLVRLNEAAKKHDRATLEKIYADEFLFMHAVGFTDNKTEHIKGIMETDSVSGFVLTAIDNLHVITDNMAIYRNPFRGPAGNLSMGTTIYAKRNGNWQIIQIQGTTQQPERKWVKPNHSLLDTYTGKYQQANGATIIISRSEDTLILRSKTLAPRRFLAVDENRFYDKMGTMISFQKENDNALHCLMRYTSGLESKWMRKED
jgi:hypothetical protein